MAAVDLDDLTYQVVRSGRGKKHHSPGDLLRGSLTSHRDAPHQRLAYVGGVKRS
jgi:hypothetical protein